MMILIMVTIIAQGEMNSKYIGNRLGDACWGGSPGRSIMLLLDEYPVTWLSIQGGDSRCGRTAPSVRKQA